MINALNHQKTALLCGTRSFRVVGHRTSGTGSSRRLVIRAAQGQGQGERQPWDFGRFAKTVLFFNDPPSPEKIISSIFTQPLKIAKAMMGSDVEEKKTSALEVIAPQLLSEPILSDQKLPSEGLVMVSGATGGVGKRVVRELLARGAKVRALVRDLEFAKDLLGSYPAAPGGALELVPVDITQRQTLLPEYFENVRALLICSAVKISPKEGDTSDRKKYYQGIKFYDPEVVGDTPEMVELNGVSNLLRMTAESLGLREGKTVLGPESTDVTSQWGNLDDVVMGGCSESSLIRIPGAGEDGADAIVFRGNVTAANNGGFASVRSKNFEGGLDLGGYDGVSLRLRGNGQRFKMIIRTDTNWDGIGFCRSFDTVDGEWQTINLPFSEFIPVFRAKTVKDGAKLNPTSIASIQLMLSKFEYDGELNPNFSVGEFALPMSYIKGYLKEPQTPRVVLVSSSGVTRCDRPGIDISKQPPAVRMNDELGGILTYKLKGEDVVRHCGVPFAIVRPCALTEEPKGAPLEFDQGDEITGKISREEIAEFCVELLSQSAPTDTTFEVKSTIPFSQPFEPKEAPEARDWTTLLEKASLRKGVTGKTVGGVYTGRDVEAEALNKAKA
ncbi:hypothetical protein BSKO_09596 [Bryopsis sp. KO-2023]|nr:hypothetical protein BSKO_09596 [Bryopsis sp. KO-2023]